MTPQSLLLAAQQFDHAPSDGSAGGPTAPSFGPRLTAAEAALLPAKLLWSLVAWYRVAGEYETAAALLDDLEARSGPTLQGIEERARLAFAMGRVAAAVALWEERLELSATATARAALARLHLEAGNLSAAAAISAELSREQSESATVGALAADVARASGDLATARAYYEGVVATKPDNANAIVALARIALLGGDVREAVARLDQALAVASEAATAGQLSAAAAIAEVCDQPLRAAALRHRAMRLEIARGARLAREVDVALGRPPAGDTGPSPVPSRADRADGAMAERAPIGTDSPLSTPIPDLGAPTSSPTPVKATAAGERGGSAEPPLSPAAPDVPIEPRVLEALRRDFGHDALRPGQAAVIANVLAGRDTLAIMPTGAGKSLTFQLPALLMEGTTLVISPLIALMKDQVESLPPAVRERTALINSTLSAEEQRRILDRVADGAYKLVYAAPERLRQHAFLRAMRAAGTALVVVDEAHCISLWGHDFRPDYLTIPSALPELGDPPVLAITATATPRMAAAIAAGFGRDLERVRISVFRSNLFYEVHRLANREEKVAKVVEVCREERGAGIVYVSSRKDAEAIAGVLRDRGVGAIPYHAGLDPATRARNQERFMRGQARVVVATVAFGMGVDKRDVRFIVHLNPPRSLEAYAQESGRAGRDGEPARCVLLTAPSDQASLNRLARRDELDLDTLRRVYAGVKRAAAGRWATLDPETLLPPPAFDDDPDEVADPRIALGLLEQADLVRRHPDAPVSYTLQRVAGVDASAGGEQPVDDDAVWGRFAAWAGLDTNGRAGVTIRTAEACDALDLSPVELARLLGGRADWTVLREGPRLVCLELRPVANDAGARLADILARARDEARQRIALVMAYAAGARCRHVVLANHLGEALAPCGTACDVCTGTVTTGRRGREVDAVTGDGATVRRTALTADDALAVLHAVRTLPFPMGKPGLTKLLLGSVESRVRADRSPAFGALAGFTRGKVEGLIDRLVEDGFLDRDLGHEFKVIRLTRRGAEATLDDLAGYEERPRPAAVTIAGSRPRPADVASGSDEDAELGPDDRALLDRLHAWRRERAIRDAVPPYVVAHNSMLLDVVQARPTSAAALERVKGFGPARVEKYGDEILAVVADR